MSSNCMLLPSRFIHQATRYAMGRMSYAVSEHCDWLVANWNNLPEGEKEIVRQDLEKEFERDDKFRNDNYGPLGMDTDRKEWERVRQLWK